jgi:hypothetical protein
VQTNIEANEVSFYLFTYDISKLEKDPVDLPLNQLNQMPVTIHNQNLWLTAFNIKDGELMF